MHPPAERDPEARRVEAEARGVRDQVRLSDAAGEQRVVVAPERGIAALGARLFGGLGREGRVLVEGEGEVPEVEAHGALREQAGERRRRVAAVRALEVAEHDHGHERRAGPLARRSLDRDRHARDVRSLGPRARAGRPARSSRRAAAREEQRGASQGEGATHRSSNVTRSRAPPIRDGAPLAAPAYAMSGRTVPIRASRPGAGDGKRRLDSRAGSARPRAGLRACGRGERPSAPALLRFAPHAA